MTAALHQFLAKKRQGRTRGKLAGLATQIQELKELGATSRDIAEYLHLEYGVTVTPSAVQKHLKAIATRSTQAANDLSAPESARSAVPKAQSPTPPRDKPLGNASTPTEPFEEARQVEGARIENRSELPQDDVVTRYSFGSPEHQEKLATYRQRKNQSKT